MCTSHSSSYIMYKIWIKLLVCYGLSVSPKGPPVGNFIPSMAVARSRGPSVKLVSHWGHEFRRY